MQYSGYQKKFRYEVINSAYKAYKTLLGKETAGEQKDDKKVNWYGEHSCVFIPLFLIWLNATDPQLRKKALVYGLSR